MDLFNPDRLHHLAQKYHLRPSKQYGQNYLINPNVIETILQAGELSSNDTVIEVGPGFGVLTLPLAERVHRLYAFEIEKKLEPYWGEVMEMRKIRNLEIIWGNILKEFHNFKISQFPYYKVIANLPYQITSPVIRLFLEQEHPPELMVLMVQKEVGERICATPGDMSVLSVMVQYYADPELILIVPKDNFWPAPKVDSAIVKLRINPDFALAQNRGSAILSKRNRENEDLRIRDVGTQEQFFRLVKMGFANRRKLLIKNLEPYVGKKNRATLRDVFDTLGLLPTARAQELSVEQWKELAKKLEIRN